MAARLYTKGKENLLSGNVDLQNDTIVALLVTGQYIPDTDADDTRAAIPSSAIVGEATLQSTKINNGVFDADDVVFTEVSGAPIRYIVIIKDADIFQQAPLICLIDDAPQFPVVPDGTNITIQWDNGSNKIFKI